MIRVSRLASLLQEHEQVTSLKIVEIHFLTPVASRARLAETDNVGQPGGCKLLSPQTLVATDGWLKPTMSDNQDARWIKAFRMQAGVLQELDEATMRRERVAVRKILRMEKAAHVVPVGLIQLTDFASDIMVIVQIATTAGGSGADWIVCAVAVGLSLLVA